MSMDFDELEELQGRATRIFETEVNKLLKVVLDDINGDEFNVISSIEDSQVINPDQARKGLRIVLNVYLDVRAGTQYDTASLIEEVKKALDEGSERDAFILLLQEADNPSFGSINFLDKFTINNDEIRLTQKGGDNYMLYYIIGGGIAAGVVAFLVTGIACTRRRRESMSLMSFTDPDFISSPVDPRISS